MSRAYGRFAPSQRETPAPSQYSRKYVNYLGFPALSEAFELHASYFRGALVRASYRNAPAKALHTRDYPAKLYDNIVDNAGHILGEEDLICPELSEHPELLRNIDPIEALIKHM